MRPTFTIEFPINAESAIARLESLVRDEDYPIEGRVAGNHLMLVIPPSRRHFWSPWLHLEVHEENVNSKVKGKFSPNPSVWTGFMLTYIALATLVFFAALFGVSQWMMDKPPSALMLTSLPILIAVVMYWSSLIGQRIAQEQMRELYDASMKALSSGQSLQGTAPISADLVQEAGTP